MPADRIGPHAGKNGMTGWDYGAIIALAGVGFSLSYDALREVAVAIHVRPSLSYFFPIVIDGFIAYGVRAIVLLRHRRFGARLYAWFLFLTATGASLWANALHAVTLNREPVPGRSALRLGDGVVGVLSTLAPLALAGSVHLYILMARTTDSSVRDHAHAGPGPARNRMPVSADNASTVRNGPLPEAGELSPALGGSPGPSAVETPAEAPPELRKYERGQAEVERLGETDEVPSAHADEASGGPADGSGPPDTEGADRPDDRDEPAAATTGDQREPRMVRDRTDGEDPSVPDGADAPEDREADDAWLDELLPIAREASRRAGRISRDSVAPAVRSHQPIGNERLGVLIARLKKEEEEGSTKKPAGASAALW